MTQEEFKKMIEQEIRSGESLLQRFEKIQSIGGAYGLEKYNEEERQGLTNDLQMWEDYVRQILNNYFGTTNSEIVASFSISNPNGWLSFRSNGISCMNGNLTTLKSILKRLPLIDMNRASKDVGGVRGIGCSNSDKPYKVFISHSSEDKEFVDALVSLLEFIGIRDSEKLFCSSITGYMVPNSKIFATIC